MSISDNEQQDFLRALYGYLDQEELAELYTEKLASAAKDLLTAKVAALPQKRYFDRAQIWETNNLADVFEMLHHSDLIPLARLLAIPNPEQHDFVQIGKTLHDLVLKQLYKEALEEAEELM